MFLEDIFAPLDCFKKTKESIFFVFVLGIILFFLLAPLEHDHVEEMTNNFCICRNG